jgi:aspartate/methionine/tyrosine aminotransferase
MEWAKLRSTARFNLATSGIASVTRAEFPGDERLAEITAPGGYGYAPLQERLAQHCGVPSDCVVAAAGTSMANHLAMAAVLEPGDRVLIEQPTYGPLLDVAHYLGARVGTFARRFEDKFAVDVAEVVAALTPDTRLIVLTNLHNPTGVMIERDTLRELGAIAVDRGIHVLVDEVYLEMLFGPEAPRSYQIGETLAPRDENPFIVSSSLTKAYGLSGLRCGWVIAAPKLARRMWLLNDLFGVNAAHPAEQLSVIAFDHLPAFRARAEKLLAINRPILDAFLASRPELEVVPAVAGTVAFPRLKRGAPDALFELLRRKYDTSVVPGRFFDMPAHFRIGIGGDAAELREGLARVGAALDELSR